MPADLKSPILADIIRAALLWPIWLRLGLQDLRLRFRRSSLGVGWIFINLALMVLAIGFVYSQLLGQKLAGFVPFLTAGLLVWTYITSSIVEGSNAFVVAEGYIKQIGLPIYVYVFRSFVQISLTMLMSLSAYIFVAVIYRVSFSWGLSWAVPGLLLVSAASLLCIVIFAHLNARFRDVGHMAGLGLQITFFVTPVLWPPELLRQGKTGWIVDWNPFYHLLEVVRQPLLQSQAASTVNYVAVGAFLLCLLGVAVGVTARYHRRIVYFL